MCSSTSHIKPSKQAHNATNPDYDFTAGYSIICCHDKDFCNNGSFPEMPREGLYFKKITLKPIII
jgi:hypothetical protein